MRIARAFAQMIVWWTRSPFALPRLLDERLPTARVPLVDRHALDAMRERGAEECREELDARLRIDVGVPVLVAEFLPRARLSPGLPMVRRPGGSCRGSPPSTAGRSPEGTLAPPRGLERRRPASSSPRRGVSVRRESRDRPVRVTGFSGSSPGPGSSSAPAPPTPSPSRSRSCRSRLCEKPTPSARPRLGVPRGAVRAAARPTPRAQHVLFNAIASAVASVAVTSSSTTSALRPARALASRRGGRGRR